jgi:hypothetical protein
VGGWGILLSETAGTLAAKISKVKVKVNFTLEQATKARRGSRSIAVLFL